MRESDKGRWQHWFLLIFHDDGESLEHPYLEWRRWSGRIYIEILSLCIFCSSTILILDNNFSLAFYAFDLYLLKYMCVCAPACSAEILDWMIEHHHHQFHSNDIHDNDVIDQTSAPSPSWPADDIYATEINYKLNSNKKKEKKKNIFGK